MTAVLPKYPVYIPSKGRWQENRRHTAKHFLKDGVPFKIVVEPQEADNYAEAVGEENVLVLPFSDLGQGSIPARNWIWEHAIEQGATKHHVYDDNIDGFRRLWRSRRIPCHAGMALRVVEEVADRYENVAIAGLAYQMFVTPKTTRQPWYQNVHCYSTLLIRNELPNRWRGRYNEDTDLCLQVLADGWCTILINTFMATKLPSMVMQGGNTDELYKGDGRLKMARALERQWPGVVKVERRYGRPQHVVDWRKFKTPLQRRTDIDWDNLPSIDEFGLQLRQVREVESDHLRAAYEQEKA